MTTAESISKEICDWLGRRTMLSTGTRQELHRLVAQKFSAVAPRQQPSLDFPDVTAGRHGGNRQSLLAAKDGSGRRVSQRQRVFTFLHSQAERGATCAEISAGLNMPYQTCSGRCSELLRDGLILRTARTRKTELGSEASVLVVI